MNIYNFNFKKKTSKWHVKLLTKIKAYYFENIRKLSQRL